MTTTAEGGFDMDCAFCTSRIDHCHGTLVVHSDSGFSECTDGSCVNADRVRHGLIIDCGTVDGGCGCVEEPAELLQRAS